MTTTRADRISAPPAFAAQRAPVLALHGAAGSSRQWLGLARHLGNCGVVVAPDLPGYGTASAQAPCDAARSAEHIIRLMAIDDEPMHIVGHSIGAAVALEIAMSRPDLVRSLTLIEPAVFHLLRDGGRLERAMFGELHDLAEGMALSVEAGDGVGAMRAYSDYWGVGNWDRSAPALRDNLARQAACVTASLSASLRTAWPLARLGALHMPTRVVMALESPAAGMRVTEMVAEALPLVRLTMVPGAGHLSLLTDPHVVVPTIAEHLMCCDFFGNRRASISSAA